MITTPFSFVASANSILYEGARPVFCDIDRRTLNLDPAAAAAAVTPRTSGILPVHIFGYPADMPAFEGTRRRTRAAGWSRTPARRSGRSHGDGRVVGGRGHPAVFAFYPNKQVATGEGGAVVCASAGMKARIDSERNQGARA